VHETTVADSQLYLQCLYTDRMVTLNHYDSGISSMTPIRLYVLGDYLGDDRFCNHIIDALIGHSVFMNTGMVFSSAAVDLAWEKTTSGSTLRRVLLELIVCDLDSVPFASVFEDKGTWAKEVLIDIFNHMAGYPEVQVAINAAMESLSENSVDCGEYHRHGEDDPKCSIF
jgi:hypothetical protein